MASCILHLQRVQHAFNISKPGTKRIEDATVGFLRFLLKESSQTTPIYSCITIENGGSSSALANKDRRILPGEYYIKPSSTKVPLPREYQGTGLLLCSRTNALFETRRIFIHSGNYPQDTEGCILLQSHYDFTSNPGYGGGSMRAVKTLYDLVYKYGVDNCTLLIHDELQPLTNLGYPL